MPVQPVGFSLTVPAHPASLRLIRKAILSLREVCGVVTTDRLAVIYSELVTNAIRHAGLEPTEEIRAELESKNGQVRGSVTDPGRGFDPDAVPEPDLELEHGFGLYIVSELASRWGVDRGKDCRVWFEL